MMLLVEDQRENRLRADVEMIAGSIGERNLWKLDALTRAADYIRSALLESGYLPAAQTFTCRGRVVQNIEALLEGSVHPREAVVAGAHYDSVIGCPGANDNATGVAAVLELARRFAGRPSRRTIRFVLFVNEEPPFFQTAEMGSVVYAQAARARGDRISAMLSLETMGYFVDEPGSQTYPGGLGRLLPDTGNFIGMVSNFRSAPLLWRTARAFRKGSTLPLQALPAPAGLPGVGWSDHWSFWEAGYPALMVTDTAPYRYPWYHTPHDTPDKVRFDKLSAVVDGLERGIRVLAG